MPETVTPMMQQYRRVRSGLPAGTILFFRLGDFYEMFYDDAKEASRILDIALTKRNGMPMCGVPYHSADSYLAKLIRAGKKVAICDQMEEPSAGKGIVRREVTSVVTPGTVIEGSVLESSQHNYLAGVCAVGGVYGLAMLDLSTGAFWGEETSDAAALADNLRRYAPNECLVPAEQAEEPGVRAALGRAAGAVVSSCEGWPFEYAAAHDDLVRHFAVHSLQGFGCEGRVALVGAAGGVLHYVREELHRDVRHVRALRVNNPSAFMVLDETTCSNLDLVPGRSPGAGRSESPSLLRVLDATCTPMGSRMMREWVLRPLASAEGISARHAAVEALSRDRELLHDLRDRLAGVRDLERLIARLGAGSGNARDLRSLGESLDALPGIRDLAGRVPAGALEHAASRITPLPELKDLIARSIADEPPMTVKEGGLVRRGYNADLDELRDIATESRKWLAEYQAAEQTRTGIKTLKIRNNKVFGYYIEVSRGQAGNVPEHYIRKQTIVNGERYITPELKEYEGKIVGAQDRSMALEYEIFQQIREAAVRETESIQASADALATLDVLAALADRALALRYVRPTVTAGDAVRIKGGRHPVIEQMPDAERFVPNDTRLDGADHQVIIITGPNMAGKSTYIRQVALIVIMAQMGSFVPAAEAEIGVVDRVFTRVGASDDLARGRSTFMVEMQETANILHNATPRSLIVLDEIGRGTSTFDGISIAWAVAEYLHGNPAVKAKTLFATHYHELTDLALTMPGVKNYTVSVRERDDRVVFLRRIVPGAADKSYGIQVARLAGLPAEVIDRAKEVLSNLEEGEFGESGQPKLAKHSMRRTQVDISQLPLFGGGDRT